MEAVDYVPKDIPLDHRSFRFGFYAFKEAILKYIEGEK